MTQGPPQAHKATGHGLATPVLFALVVLTGFVNLGWASWSPAFRLNLFLHPLLGIISTITIIRSLFSRIQTEVPGLKQRHLWVFIGLCLVPLARGFTLEYLPDVVSDTMIGRLTPFVLIGAMYFFFRVVPLLPRVAKARRAWPHLSLVSLWLLSLVSGLGVLSGAFGTASAWVVHLHAFIGMAVLVVGGFVLWVPSRKTGRKGAPLRGVGIALAAFALITTVANGAGSLRGAAVALPSVEVQLSVLPFAHGIPAENPVAASARTSKREPFPIDASWLQITDSCGGSGCHSELVEDFRHSIHNISYRTDHMHRVLDLLNQEMGDRDEELCAGCHTPAALFRGGSSSEAFRTQDNMSCVLCHSISEVAILDADRSSYTLSLHGDHLRTFVAAERSDRQLSPIDRAMIQLNTRAHAAVFRNELHGEDRFCQSCHHLQLFGARQSDDEVTASCVDCHMETRSSLGLEGNAANHFFPGSNTTIPTLLGLDEATELTTRWMRGAFFIRTLEDLYNTDAGAVRAFGQARKGDFYYGEMSSRFAHPPTPGQRAKLEITTHNLSMGHAFPSSSIDLQEVWLDVHVTDGSGRTVFRSGAVDDGQPATYDMNATRVRLRERLRSGALDKREIDIDVRDSSQVLGNIFGNQSFAQTGMDLSKMMERLHPSRTKQRKLTVKDAMETLAAEEAEGLVDDDVIAEEAIRLVENAGIVFLDELDKVAGREGGRGPDVSREGVQRDLLPLIEGTTVSTRHGPVKTDHILFIAAGAFHVSKPSDLLPELQGRIPIRVRLDDLTEADFVRILSEPKNALTKQSVALLATEGVKLRFTDDAVTEMARVAATANAMHENIGARRLSTVMERVLEDVSFDAPNMRGQKIHVDGVYVRDRVQDLIEDQDLGRFVL